MWWIIIGFLLFWGAFGKSVCIEKVNNGFNEPYLSYALTRMIEKALIESGRKPGCHPGSVPVTVSVLEFEEIPIAYTPQQRVSSYNLMLKIRVELGKEEFVLENFVPYYLPYGGMGDLPRRKAIDDLLDKIYLELLQKLERR